MTEISWTPGPWHSSATHFGAAYDVGAENGANIALVRGFEENGADEFVANARLIAAAPDLYEALANLLAVQEGEGGTRYHAGDIARAALAKARGGA